MKIPINSIPQLSNTLNTQAGLPIGTDYNNTLMIFATAYDLYGASATASINITVNSPSTTNEGFFNYIQQSMSKIQTFFQQGDLQQVSSYLYFDIINSV